MTASFLRNHLIITLFGFIMIAAFGAAEKKALDFAVGSVLSGSNLALLIWMGERTLNEKGIALTLLAGVGKYVVLLAVFVVSVIGIWNPTEFFVLGILTMLPSVGLYCFSLREVVDGSF